MKAKTLREHFYSLCNKHKVTIKKWTAKEHGSKGHTGLGGLSDREERIVWVTPIRGHASYTVAMHELGHVLGPWQHRPILEREAGAWKWAKENALVWGPASQFVMHRGMKSYYHAAICDHLTGTKRPLALPAKSHYFWQCIERILPGPEWLSKDLHVVPWADVIADTQRPRCETCRHWQPHHLDQKGTEWGTCASPQEPMGVRPLVPASALCGGGYRANIQ